MMAWEDVNVQLIDLPPITKDFMEGYLSSMVRSADAALLVVDLGDDDGIAAADDVMQRLAETKTMLVGELPQRTDEEKAALAESGGVVLDGRVQPVKTLLVANKIDLPDAAERLELVRDLFGSRFPMQVVAAEPGQGLEELRTAIYQFLGVIRVYTKQPGKPADMTAPFTCPVGSTLLELAGLVHRDFTEKLKHARIWGTGVYEGQTVKRDHVLHDKDVVELHM
jgi:hypothetical protein